MSAARISLLTVLSLLAFAGNSVLCRIALKETEIDAATFTSVRLISGALVLCLISIVFRREQQGKGNWTSAFALFVYAAAFSFAYISLSAATGALILFASVQATMIGHSVWSGDRFQAPQILGLGLAFTGLVGLLLPGLSSPPLIPSVLMLASGVAWAVYTLRGKGAGDPTRVTSGNFLRAAVVSLPLLVLFLSDLNFDSVGMVYAIASGAIASGLGYSLWYSVLPWLKATNAATVQLSVPMIAAFGGILMLGESLTLRFVFASVAILGGIALLLTNKTESKPPQR